MEYYCRKGKRKGNIEKLKYSVVLGISVFVDFALNMMIYNEVDDLSPDISI